MEFEQLLCCIMVKYLMFQYTISLYLLVDHFSALPLYFDLFSIQLSLQFVCNFALTFYLYGMEWLNVGIVFAN